jgi:hypothetical protein
MSRQQAGAMAGNQVIKKYLGCKRKCPEFAVQ